MENLETYYTIIEDCIRQMGLEPGACKGEQRGQWNLVQGSANVWIDLWKIEGQGVYYQVMSPLIHLPEEQRLKPLYEELLSLNDKLFSVAFSLYEEMIWLKAIREARGMDVEEATNILKRIATYGDRYDDYLADKYDCKKVSHYAEITAPKPPQS